MQTPTEDCFLMSSKVGQVYFAREKNNQFLNLPQQGAAEYSQATAKLIDEELITIINQQYQKAQEILKQLQHILDKGAKILLENEKIEGKELQELMAETQDQFSEK
jgi:cell division protease FtsH